jgi:hypothetical protein
VHIDLFVVASNEGTGTGTRTGATKHWWWWWEE